MTKPTFSAKLPDVTIQQLNELAAQFGTSKSQIVIQAVRQLHQQETKTMNIELQYQPHSEYHGFAIEVATGIGGHYARATMKIDDDTTDTLECGPNDTERGALQSLRDTINDALFAHGLADEPRRGYNE